MPQNLQLPDVDDLPGACRALAREYIQRVDEASAAASAAYVIGRAERDAIRADTEASAKAKRLGVKDPGDTHQKTWAKDKAEAARQSRICAEALTSCETELRAALASALPASIPAREEALADARRKCRDAVMVLDQARGNVRRQQSLLNFARRYPHPKALSGGSPLSEVRNLIGPNGSPMTWETVRDALTADAAPEPVTAPIEYASRTVDEVNEHGVLQSRSRIREATSATFYDPADPDAALVVVPSQ